MKCILMFPYKNLTWNSKFETWKLKFPNLAMKIPNLKKWNSQFKN